MAEKPDPLIVTCPPTGTFVSDSFKIGGLAEEGEKAAVEGTGAAVGPEVVWGVAGVAVGRTVAVGSAVVAGKDVGGARLIITFAVGETTLVAVVVEAAVVLTAVVPVGTAAPGKPEPVGVEIASPQAARNNMLIRLKNSSQFFNEVIFVFVTCGMTHSLQVDFFKYEKPGSLIYNAKSLEFVTVGPLGGANTFSGL